VERRTSLLLGTALVVAVVVAYVPALRAGFVWNDDTYLTENSTLDGSRGLEAIWTNPRANEQYYPLVFTAFWLEKRLWGLNPLGFHLVNVLLHAASALLLWRLLRRLGLPGAWFGAAAFALHPMCVESVAWITERKNTLSMFMSLLAALSSFAWMDARAASEKARFRRRSEPEPPLHHRRRSMLYLAALVAFTLALLAKTTASVLPGVLLVLVWWRRGRLRWSDARPLAPFFLTGAALAATTAWLERTMVQASGAEWSLDPLGRIVLAGRVIAFYASKFFWPIDLAFVYPRWTVDARVVWQWLPVIALVAVLACALVWRRRLGRGPLAAALLFGGVLFPAIGLFNVYAMRYSYVADHFAYQAVAVAAGAIAAGVATLVSGRNVAARRAAAVVGVGAVMTLAVLTASQCRAYRDSDTLWRDTLARNPDCFMCHTNYGFSLYGRGRVAEAIDHFEQSLRIKPDNVPSLLNLAKVEEDRGRLEEAASRLRTAQAIDPTNTTVLINLGTVYTKAGRHDDAVRVYEEALRYPTPDDYLAHNGLGVALIRLGRVGEAIDQFQTALRLRPDYGMARANLERALAMQAGQR
jgi:tetratricopeptide (TPR) repeat protein